MSSNSNNRNNDQYIREDIPQMRSVAIGSLSPPMPVARAVMRSSKAVLHETPKVIRPEPVKFDTVVALPVGHLLERTHVRISNCSGVSYVASRVAEALREESVAATFHQKEALIRAETAEHVEFCIRLWRDNDDVVVEIQRVAGCCFLFHQTAKAILRAAKGQAKEAPREFKLPSCIPRVSEEEERDCLLEGLEIASTLLKKDRLDAHQLAVESLAQLTKSTCRNRVLAAERVLSGEFLDTILSLIQSWQMTRTEKVMLSEMEKEHFALMHRNALTILANCLTCLQDAKKLQATLQKQEELTSITLITALVDEIRNACDRPHDACQAIRSLKVLILSSVEVKNHTMTLGADSAIRQAQSACRHKRLEEESKSFMGDDSL